MKDYIIFVLISTLIGVLVVEVSTTAQAILPWAVLGSVVLVMLSALFNVVTDVLDSVLDPEDS